MSEASGSASSSGPGARLAALKTAVSRRGSSLNASVHAKDVRIQLDGEFERVNGYSYDYVFVFQVHDESVKLTDVQKEFSMRTILQKLARGGIETKMFYSVDREHVFCKLRASLERLGKEADRIDYRVEFDPIAIRAIAEAGYPDQHIAPIHIEHNATISTRDPFQNLFAKYDVEPRLQPAYKKYGHKQSPFRGVDRIKLLLHIVKAHVSDGGCALHVEKLLSDACLVSAFPLHEPEELLAVRDKWMPWRLAPWQQPLAAIKDYFGEKVGLYFAWLGHYTTWLLAPAAVGVLLFFNVVLQRTADATLVPYFGLFMAIWSTLYYEYWKRYNSVLALEWGMANFEDEEVERPEFQGDEIISPIDGSKIRYFSPQMRFRRIMGSIFFIFVLILMVVAVVASIFLFRWAATNGPWHDLFTVDGVALGGAAASTVNAIQIMVMNNLYSSVALRLNNFENHRTDTEFEDHLIAKTFLFQFVNSYASLFYVAFMKSSRYFEGPESCKGGYMNGCMDELMMGLGIIFVLRLTSGNFFEVGLPWLKKKFAGSPKQGQNEPLKNAAATVYRGPSEIERQLSLDAYDLKGTFDDYNEMIIQFGYVTLFVVSFPLAPALALLNNYFEIRVDAFKLVTATRRPDPRGAQDIGTWGTIIELMSTISVVTNIALVCFTSVRVTENFTPYQRMWLFLGVEHVLVAAKYLLQMLVDDEPSEVVLQKQRTQFVVDKIVHLIADDDDAALSKGNQVRVDLTVFDEDV